MPKNVMREPQFKVFEELVKNPQWESKLGRLSAREYYDQLPLNDKNAVSLLVHFAAFLYSEGSIDAASQRQIMIDDAMRKGGDSGERLLMISNRAADAIELLQERGIVGNWAYVPQAGGEITYGLDAGGGDLVIEDLRGRPGYKGMQMGTTPRNVSKKEKELVAFYGVHMQGEGKILGLFPALDSFGALLEKEKLADVMADELSKTAIVVPTN